MTNVTKFGYHTSSGLYVDPMIKIDICSFQSFIDQLENSGYEFVAMNDEGVLTRLNEYPQYIMTEQDVRQYARDEIEMKNPCSEIALDVMFKHPKKPEKQASLPETNYEIS